MNSVPHCALLAHIFARGCVAHCRCTPTVAAHTRAPQPDCTAVRRAQTLTAVSRQFDGYIPLWHHCSCFFASESKTDWGKDDFKGFMDLRPDDKIRIEEWLGGAKRPADEPASASKAAKKAKTETAAEKKVREHDEQLWAIRDQLSKAKSTSVLKAILDHNGVSSRGNDVTLAGRCADIMLHGVPGRCPAKFGTVSDESGSVKVQGSAKEPYTVTAIRHEGETEPFKIKCTCPAYEFNGKTCKHEGNWTKIKEWSAAALTCGARLRYEDGHFKCHAYADAFTPCSYNQPTGPREPFVMPPKEERGSGGKDLDAYLDTFKFKKTAVPREMLDDIRQQDKTQKVKDSARAAEEEAAQDRASEGGGKGKGKKGKSREEEETVTLTLDLDSTGGQAGSVDPDTGKDAGAHRVLQQGDVVYACLLNRADIAKRKNSFYKLQIVQEMTTGRTWLFKKWGAIGGKGGGVEGGDHRLIDGDLSACIKLFEEEFQKRSGNAWVNRRAFSMKPGKYNLSELADAVELHTAKGKELPAAGQVASKLPPRVVGFVCVCVCVCVHLCVCVFCVCVHVCVAGSPDRVYPRARTS